MRKIFRVVLMIMSIVFGVFMLMAADDGNLGGTVAMCSCMCGALLWDSLDD